MVDLIILIILTNFNAKTARKKGYVGYNYGWMTVGLWLGSEIIMAFISAIIWRFDITVMMLFSVLGATIGGVSSYLIVRNLKPKGDNYPPNSGQNWTYTGNNRGYSDYPWQPYGQTQPITREFKRNEGDGVCDVCGGNISGSDGFLVPIDVFYTSQKYKDWLIENPVTQAGVQSLGGPDKYLAYMRSKDNTQYSTVCTSCVDFFK